VQGGDGDGDGGDGGHFDLEQGTRALSVASDDETSPPTAPRNRSTHASRHVECPPTCALGIITFPFASVQKTSSASEPNMVKKSVNSNGGRT
jgi:hypothetical protein